MEPPVTQPLNPETSTSGDYIWIEFEMTPVINQAFHNALSKVRGRAIGWWIMFGLAFLVVVVFLQAYSNPSSSHSTSFQPQTIRSNPPSQHTLMDYLPVGVAVLGGVVYWLLARRSRLTAAKTQTLVRWRIAEKELRVYHDESSFTEFAWKSITQITGTKDGYLLATSQNMYSWISIKGFKSVAEEQRFAVLATRYVEKCLNFKILQCQGCKYDLSRTIADGKSSCPECGKTLS
jgi:hypothetical protein